MVASLAGDPGIERRERPAQRFDLADTAALFVPVAIEGEQTLFAHQFLDGVRLRKEHFDGNVVMLADLVDELIGLRMQAPRIERKDANLAAQLRCQIHQNHILGATEADSEARRILLDGEGENFPRVSGGISRGKFVDVCALDGHSLSLRR